MMKDYMTSYHIIMIMARLVQEKEKKWPEHHSKGLQLETMTDADLQLSKLPFNSRTD